MSPQQESKARAPLQSTADRSAELDQRRTHVETRLRRLDRLAELLDDQFEIPVIDRRVGLDPLIGLLPGGGDWVTWVAGVYILWMAARLDAPPGLLVRMAGHLTLDLLGGYLPVAGDIFDAAYKSNRKNVDLLFEHFDYRPGSGGSDGLPEQLPDVRHSRWKTYLAAAGLMILLAALAAGPIVLAWWLFGG